MSEQFRRCEFVKPDGIPCAANALRNRQFCFFHDPSVKAARDEARREGGRERSRRTAVLPDAPDLHLNTHKDVLALLSETGSQLRRGELDPRIANGLFYLCSIALTALKQGPQEEQLDRIESVLKSQQLTSELEKIDFVNDDEDLSDASEEDPYENDKAKDDQNEKKHRPDA